MVLDLRLYGLRFCSTCTFSWLLHGWIPCSWWFCIYVYNCGSHFGSAALGSGLNWLIPDWAAWRSFRSSFSFPLSQHCWHFFRAEYFAEGWIENAHFVPLSTHWSGLAAGHCAKRWMVENRLFFAKIGFSLLSYAHTIWGGRLLHTVLFMPFPWFCFVLSELSGVLGRDA
jgi:hypothetical protein